MEAASVQPRADAPGYERHRALTWAQRLKCVFRIDIERCGGKVRIIASIEDPPSPAKVPTFAHVLRIHDLTGHLPVAQQELHHARDRLLGRRDPDALWRCRAQGLQPFQRQREVRATLVAGKRVQLVEDHGAHIREHLAREALRLIPIAVPAAST